VTVVLDLGHVLSPSRSGCRLVVPERARDLGGGVAGELQHRRAIAEDRLSQAADRQ
jgi:hypothetical protein